MKRKLTKTLAILLGGALLLGACGQGGTKNHAGTEQDPIKVGIVSADTRVWDDVNKRLLEKDNIHVELVQFTDYNQPNDALQAGDIDLNSFQHQFFLDSYNKDKGTKLVSIGKTISAPLGIYSKKVKTIQELGDGAKIAIPNDATNGGRALVLLETAGLIKLNTAAGNLPVLKDITENPKKLEITELDAAQTARVLDDVDASIINSGMAVDAGFTPSTDAIYLEPVDAKSEPYINIIAAREADKDNELYKKIVAEYQTEATAKVITDTSKGSQTKAW